MGKRKHSTKSDTVSTEDVRHQLFYVWSGLFLLYVVTFLFSSMKSGIGFPLAIDATWKVAYLIVPVLGAFAGFWFGPAAPESDDEVEVIDKRKRRAMFILTAALHSFVYMVIIIGILGVDFRDQETPVSYSQRVDIVLKFMLLIWSVSLLPIGWLLKGTKIPQSNLK